jgi:hypothetical protein
MSCFNVDVSTTYCDSAHQQIPPVQATGSEYVGVRYRNRLDNTTTDETPPWRIVGMVDNTKLTWLPKAPTGAPTTLSAGQLVKFPAAGPFVVKSQDDAHPFYMGGHMTGCSTVGSINGQPQGCVGDAEWVNVVAAKEWLNDYVFFTDPTYPESDLVLTRGKGSDGQYHDVKLDCAGVIQGWTNIGSTEYQYTRFDLVRYDFAKQNNCDNGRHEIKSQAPFGLTVWGWGSIATSTYTQAVSYAYPAGMSVQPINTVVVLPVPH